MQPVRVLPAGVSLTPVYGSESGSWFPGVWMVGDFPMMAALMAFGVVITFISVPILKPSIESIPECLFVTRTKG